VTFVRPDRWLSTWHEPPPDEAWRYIARQYLRAYGPATRAEFARWWGMPPAAAGRVLQLLGDGIVQVSIEGAPAWALREDVATLRRPVESSGTARLLPAFDVYTIGQRPRHAIVSAEGKAACFGRPAGCRL
jgi:hypothetical protein